MSTTILARDLKPGDVIDFGGQVFTVAEVELHPDVPDVLYVRGSVHIRQCFSSTLSLDPGQPLNVQRPDPDAELVEVMARAAWERNGSTWRSSAVYANNARNDQRAALAAAREAGLL